MADDSGLKLGIKGLPALGGSMIAGGSYLCQIGSPLAHQSMVAQTLATAMAAGLPTVLCTGGAPERIVERGRELGLGDFGQATADGRLKVFSLQDGAGKNVFRHGPNRFLIEFEHFHVADGAFILFDGAEEIFTVNDSFVASEQARSYREWVAAHQSTALFCFSMLAPGGQTASTYQALLDHVDGAARIESGRDQMDYVIEFWRSPLGVVASRTLSAALDAKGLLTASEHPGTGTASPADNTPAADENVFYSLDSTLQGLSSQDSANWHFAGNLVGLLHASRNAKAATIILIYTRSTDLRELAQAAHTLRTTLGPRLRIVVRELDASLRYQNELLLLKLGVNLVVHRELPVSRLPLALETLRGQVFGRDLELDFDAALAAVTPPAIRGAVPLPNFLRAARDILERSRAVGIPYALVSMPLTDSTDLKALFARFHITRDGDFLSVSSKQVLLFLSACAQSNILPTIGRLAGENAVEELPPQTFSVSETEITARLAQAEHDGPHPASVPRAVATA